MDRKKLVPFDLKNALSCGKYRSLSVIAGEKAACLVRGSNAAVKCHADISGGINERNAPVGDNYLRHKPVRGHFEQKPAFFLRHVRIDIRKAAGCKNTGFLLSQTAGMLEGHAAPLNFLFKTNERCILIVKTNAVFCPWIEARFVLEKACIRAVVKVKAANGVTAVLTGVRVRKHQCLCLHMKYSLLTRINNVFVFMPVLIHWSDILPQYKYHAPPCCWT